MNHITTFTDEDFTPLEPHIDQIQIEDIAHALSLVCRANEHFARFYSVAQHCLNCAAEAEAWGLSERLQLACLLHDGSEAYLSDITRPVKKTPPPIPGDRGGPPKPDLPKIPRPTSHF